MVKYIKRKKERVNDKQKNQKNKKRSKRRKKVWRIIIKKREKRSRTYQTKSHIEDVIKQHCFANSVSPRIN